jgi:hypothetical protein
MEPLGGFEILGQAAISSLAGEFQKTSQYGLFRIHHSTHSRPQNLANAPFHFQQSDLNVAQCCQHLTIYHNHARSLPSLLYHSRCRKVMKIHRQWMIIDIALA